MLFFFFFDRHFISADIITAVAMVQRMLSPFFKNQYGFFFEVKDIADLVFFSRLIYCEVMSVVNYIHFLQPVCSILFSC